MNKTNKSQKPSMAIRVLKAPARVVFKIRDLYVSSMYSCAAGMGAGPTGPYTSGLPKSYSTTSSRTDEDFAELMRIASTRISLGNKLDHDQFLGRQEKAVVPRSQSVAIGRIDEEKSCHFGHDITGLNSEMFPRSRSHAVSRVYA
ncbi:hypothetical protein QVD17_24932 [Tagetes erecta]|uniref:Uncharacterized protein n=1 Tax=Tagetes erecta TaxID=13708 RepID=A0AAD8KJ52_TARER|nr:hypothetical protein QVD17_24932 [Tagetes erecta]